MENEKQTTSMKQSELQQTELENPQSEPRGEETKRKKIHINTTIRLGLFLMAAVVYLELILETVIVKEFSLALLFNFLYAIPVGFCLAYWMGFGKRHNIALTMFWVVLSTLCLAYEVQLIYHKVFGTFMEIVMMRMGPAAVTSFFKETINAIVKNFHNVLLFLLPLGAAGFLLKKKVLVLRRHSRKGRNHLLLVWLCGYLVFVLSLIIGGVGALTPFQSYFSSYTETEQSVRRIGLAATMQGELRQALLPLEIEFESRTDTLVFVDDMGELIEDIQGEEPESEPDEESTQILPLAQVLPELEFSKLQSEDEDIQRLNEYFAGKEPTEKNRYTGFFEGYNLIYICAESWHPAVIRKDMMPTAPPTASGSESQAGAWILLKSVTKIKRIAFPVSLPYRNPPMPAVELILSKWSICSFQSSVGSFQLCLPGEVPHESPSGMFSFQLAG